MLQLEDAKAKARRLSNEGVTLAEAERWWAAIGRWNAALALTPEDHTIHEMLAQAYMQVRVCLCFCHLCFQHHHSCFFNILYSMVVLLLPVNMKISGVSFLCSWVLWFTHYSSDFIQHLSHPSTFFKDFYTFAGKKLRIPIQSVS